MLDIFSRYRQLTLLAAVVLMQVLLLAYQIKRDRDVRLIRYWTIATVAPFEKGGNWTFSRFGDIWSGYIGLHGAHAENQQLRQQLEMLQLRNRELETQAAEAQRLRALLDFRDTHTEASMLAAQVVGGSADSGSHTLYLNRGERDHVRRNMAVITPNGIVGKIVEVQPAISQVLLINDKDSGVGALFPDSRTHGVVKGSGDPEPRMDYIVNDEKVAVGQMVVTSGDDRIFPKGLMVGTVSNAAPGNPFQAIRVKPAARLDRLEDVIILLTQQELTPKAADVSANSQAASVIAGANQTASAAAQAASGSAASQSAAPNNPTTTKPQASN